MSHELELLEEKMLAQSEQLNSNLKQIHPKQLNAAKNLIKYLTLRSEDIRELQDALHKNGLSSLASSESHIHKQLQAIRERLGKEYSPKETDPCDYDWAKWSISEKCHTLFGKKSSGSGPQIMVTVDSSFADDYTMVKNLLQNGMNVARINCAHDNETVWTKMIHQKKRASHQSGKECKIYMDLAGPK